ncbi:hypothetical protein GLOTRDRAFT_113234 [Gloeophyllum trabeum ATCC 11539]|uniref:GST N-terminal domain-containing protein n=1 Tax=Gloeophyllum trabeum (strain ATCC 11539 / FP-39264 / Madison 617) TaxID=670483 RepID=S7S460_GLOTA|nr:uncharacterized protein GLOTRDRAFT_113234 [Gloeophyllum trabeum ATCC 11539]EPQ60654.1 hypothetical protein GLOTRDRAFT_113234 [Gloeophyllum trabeum ATCC 11539]
MSESVPKASLYYFPPSIWCSAVLLALQEKGYAEDEVDLKSVDLSKGENYALAFLRLNPKATVPTLVVPFEKTLSADSESRYKALTDTKAIIEFLDKSRSAISRTNTTSSAPAPALAPATIAFTAISNNIIELLHSDEGSPNAAKWYNARDETSLQELSKSLGPFFAAKRDAIAFNIAESEKGAVQASTKTKKFWEDKKAGIAELAEVFADAGKSESELSPEGKSKRAEYFKNAKKLWETDLKAVLTRVNKEMLGPFALGDQLSLADMHLAAWLARLVSLAGGNVSDKGDGAISKLENHIGNGFVLPKDFQWNPPQRDGSEVQPVTQSKLAAFWDAVKERPSWKKVYADGLH